MAKLKDFEEMLLEKGAYIINVSFGEECNVKKISAYIKRKKYKWNGSGCCFRNKKRVPEFDIKF